MNALHSITLYFLEQSCELTGLHPIHTEIEADIIYRVLGGVQSKIPHNSTTQ